MSTVLDRIVGTKREEIAAAQARTPLRELERRLDRAPAVRDFRTALLSGRGVGIIAEVKKASPSAGVLKTDFDPLAIAHAYAQAGADAISVLTDEVYFQGKLAYLSNIRAEVACPLLRKDFLLDPYQVVEARVAGADAVLLIAEILDQDTLCMLLKLTYDLGMHALVELYDRENLPRVVESGAQLIGINNRDLRTFEVRLEHTIDLAASIPADRLLVSESGLRTADDVRRVKAAGARAVLIGETFMRSPDPKAKLQELRG